METVAKEQVYTATEWEGLHMVPGMRHIMIVRMLFITAFIITTRTSTGTTVCATDRSGRHIVMAFITALVPGLRSDIYIHIITVNMYS